jgi:hypothetical protein
MNSQSVGSVTATISAPRSAERFRRHSQPIRIVANCGANKDISVVILNGRLTTLARQSQRFPRLREGSPRGAGDSR